MNGLSSKIAAYKHMPRHLQQLSVLVGRSVHREDLMSVMETETLRSAALLIARVPLWRREVDFDDRLGAAFQSLVRRIHALHPVQMYVWTPLSNTCGLLPPVALHEVNLDFDFALIPEGILVLLGADLSDQMLLDFSETTAGRRVLEIEVSGDHWGNATY